MSALVLVVSLGFFVMGIAAIGWPVRFADFVGYKSITPDGSNEVRAVYGGFGVFIAMALMIALRSPYYAPGIYVCAMLALLGMVSGRIVSILFDGTPSGMILGAVAIESTGALILYAALRSLVAA